MCCYLNVHFQGRRVKHVIRYHHILVQFSTYSQLWVHCYQICMGKNWHWQICSTFRSMLHIWKFKSHHLKRSGGGGQAVARLVEALRCNPKDRGFDSRWCHKNFHWRGPGFDSASNRNEYQEYFLLGKGGRFVGLTTLPPSCVSTSWNLRTSSGL